MHLFSSRFGEEPSNKVFIPDSIHWGRVPTNKQLLDSLPIKKLRPKSVQADTDLLLKALGNSSTDEAILWYQGLLATLIRQGLASQVTMSQRDHNMYRQDHLTEFIVKVLNEFKNMDKFTDSVVLALIQNSTYEEETKAGKPSRKKFGRLVGRMGSKARDQLFYNLCNALRQYILHHEYPPLRENFANPYYVYQELVGQNTLLPHAYV